MRDDRFEDAEPVDDFVADDDIIVLIRRIALRLAGSGEDDTLRPPLAGITARPACERKAVLDAEGFQFREPPPSDFMRRESSSGKSDTSNVSPSHSLESPSLSMTSIKRPSRERGKMPPMVIDAETRSAMTILLSEMPRRSGRNAGRRGRNVRKRNGRRRCRRPFIGHAAWRSGALSASGLGAGSAITAPGPVGSGSLSRRRAAATSAAALTVPTPPRVV